MKYDITNRKNELTEPDMDEKRKIKEGDFERSDKSITTGQQGRSSFAPGSATQGGSNYGQGSSYLGPESYQQGQEKSEGSDYANETGSLSELHDDAPHGAGAHTNEKEANAQEEYPGPRKPDEENRATDRLNKQSEE